MFLKWSLFIMLAFVSLPLVNSTVIDKTMADEIYIIETIEGEEKELYEAWIEDNFNLCIKANYESALSADNKINSSGKELQYKELPLYIVNDKGEKVLVGYIDFSTMKSKLLDEKKFCIKLNPKISKKYHLGFNSIVSTANSASWNFGAIEKLGINSTGTLHFFVWGQSARVYHYWSDDNGTTWQNSSYINLTVSSYPGMIIDSTNNLTASGSVNAINPNLTVFLKNATSTLWDSPKTIWAGNGTNYITQYAAVLDSNDFIHFCQITSNWFDTTLNGDYLMYFNWSKATEVSNTTNNSRKIWGNSAGNVGYSGQWVNNNSADDTDFCDIDIDSNNTKYITYTGGDTDNVYISSSVNDFNTKFSIYDESTDFTAPPTIAVDPITNMIWVSWHIASGADIGKISVANTTINNWNVNWTVRNLINPTTTNQLYTPVIKALNGSILITGQVGNSTYNRTAFIINSSNNFINYSYNFQILGLSSNNSTSGVHPNFAWTNYPLWNRPHNNSVILQRPFAISTSGYVETTVFNTYLNYNDYFSSGDTCTYTSGNWNINCGDNCSIVSNTNLNMNNWTASGIGKVSGVRYIKNYDYGVINGGCFGLA